MNSKKKSLSEICNFWNEQALLGFEAGTKDIIAKKLEIQAIASFVANGMRVLDAGCGNGITAVELASRYNIDLIGVDLAKNMIISAKDLARKTTLKGSVKFIVGDVLSLNNVFGKFDLVYTERVLINLLDWNHQKQAIKNILNLLNEGGLYVMCENSQDGLDNMNSLRLNIGLPEIKRPWHNRYLNEAEICSAVFSGAKLKDTINYASTYYFLSRIVNAWLASKDGKEPEYDALINQLALQLPPIGNIGQGRIWLWQKISEI
jgi:ubiquinone/menaquinone biosynthesis C-methylase UbiE